MKQRKEDEEQPRARDEFEGPSERVVGAELPRKEHERLECGESAEEGRGGPERRFAWQHEPEDERGDDRKCERWGSGRESAAPYEFCLRRVVYETESHREEHVA